MANVHKWELKVDEGAYDSPEKARRVIEGMIVRLRTQGDSLEGERRRASRLEGELFSARNALSIERDSRQAAESGAESLAGFFRRRVSEELERETRSLTIPFQEKEKEHRSERRELRARIEELRAENERLGAKVLTWRDRFTAKVADAKRRLEAAFHKRELPLKGEYERRLHMLEEREARLKVKALELEEEYRGKLGGALAEKERLAREINEQKALLETASRTWDEGMHASKRELEAETARTRKEHADRLAELLRVKENFQKEADWLQKTVADRKRLWEEKSELQKKTISDLRERNLTLEREREEKDAEYRATVTRMEKQFGETLTQMAAALEKTKADAVKAAKPAPKPAPKAAPAPKASSAAPSLRPADIGSPNAVQGGLSPQDLVFGIAHQIRNPLAIIKTHAEFCLRRFKDDEKARTPLEAIIRSVQNLGRRLDDLVDLTRPREIRRQTMSVRQLLEQIAILLQARCRKQGVEFEQSYPDDLPEIALDPEQIKEALLHILINALEAMPGGGRLRMGVTMLPTRNIAVVEVADTGKGIAADKLAEIHRPFYSTKPGGVGLGLTLATQILSLHGGAIITDSSEGKGTSVKIYLPVEKEE